MTGCALTVFLCFTVCQFVDKKTGPRYLLLLANKLQGLMIKKLHSCWGGSGIKKGAGLVRLLPEVFFSDRHTTVD